MFFGYRQAKEKTFHFIHILFSCWLGGHSEEVPPDPIPNSAVKIFSVNGTLA
jgi:hypothetical protein